MSTDAVDEPPANWQVASRRCKKVPLDIDPDQCGACAPCDRERRILPFARRSVPTGGWQRFPPADARGDSIVLKAKWRRRHCFSW